MSEDTIIELNSAEKYCMPLNGKDKLKVVEDGFNVTYTQLKLSNGNGSGKYYIETECPYTSINKDGIESQHSIYYLSNMLVTNKYAPLSVKALASKLGEDFNLKEFNTNKIKYPDKDVYTRYYFIDDNAMATKLDEELEIIKLFYCGDDATELDRIDKRIGIKFTNSFAKSTALRIMLDLKIFSNNKFDKPILSVALIDPSAGYDFLYSFKHYNGVDGRIKQLIKNIKESIVDKISENLKLKIPGHRIREVYDSSVFSGSRSIMGEDKTIDNLVHMYCNFPEKYQNKYYLSLISGVALDNIIKKEDPETRANTYKLYNIKQMLRKLIEVR